MALDGRFTKFLAKELNQELNTGRIQRISQLGKTDFLFMIRANNKNKKLYLSLSTSLARINITNNDYKSDYTPGGFCMFLRKHLEGGIIKNIEALNDDRIIKLSLENKNDLGDLTELNVMLEMFSRYTNMIILDESNKILNAYKHLNPFDSTERTIVNSHIYELPEDNRLFQEDFKGIETFFKKEVSAKDIVENIKGISPLLANYISRESSHNNYKMFDVYLEMSNKEVNPTMSLNNKTDYYYFDVFKNNTRYYKSLSELIDNYYLEASSIERVKQVYKYLHNFSKQELKRKKHKIEKLHQDLDKAHNNDIYRIKGDILITNQYQISKGEANFKGYSYELEKDIEVELNRLLDPIQNANKYYIKYKKLKKAVDYINEQVKITKNVILYLEQVIAQIEGTYSLPDLLEIQDELKDNGFLKKRKQISKKKKPNYDTYYDEDGVMILVGKNNLQNNYLTHKYAKKDYWWFHTKEQTGSHVIVASNDELSETTIRTAANLSAYFSKSRLSSSVPIDYTQVKNIKKVPGMLGSYVTYTNQKTIYIDPDENLINSLRKIL